MICNGGATLRYVGSPHQTSLAEAGQDKYLYCVQRGRHGDAVGESARAVAPSANEQPETWKEVERWVINIGRKIYRVRYFFLFLAFNGISVGFNLRSRRPRTPASLSQRVAIVW